jgi:type VI secretion system protein ImpC
MNISKELPVIPLRLIAVADFAPSESPARSERMPPRRVDKDSFNGVLRSLCPRVAFHIEDRYSPKKALARMEFPVDDLRSFHPANLVREVESLNGMSRGRQALADLRDRKITRGEFLEKLKASPLPFISGEDLSRALETASSSRGKPAPLPASGPAPAPVPRDESALDAILDMVDSPQGRQPHVPAETTEGAARVSQFISEMFPSADLQGAADRRALNGLIAECDKALSDGLNDILGNREFRRLEASWRALKFLVDRTDFREPIQVEAVSAGKEKLVEVLSALLKEAAGAGVPVAAVVTDFEFDNSPPDMQLLKEASELAEQLQAPLLVNAAAAFFGKQDALEAARIPLLQSHLESAGFVKWDSFRKSESSRWAGVCFNRFLLRSRYGESSANKLPFRFKEREDGLWGNPSWAAGSLMTRSFARSGWCGHITGIRTGGAIEDLPVHSCRLPSGAETQIPLETVFSKDAEADFSAAGFMLLQSGENQDRAVLFRAPSAHHPETYSDARETETSRWRSMLTHQLVAAQFVRYLEPILQELPQAAGPSEVERSIEQKLRALTAQGGAAAVQATVRESEERPGSYEFHIHIRPGPSIWSLPIDLGLRF